MSLWGIYEAAEALLGISAAVETDGITTETVIDGAQALDKLGKSLKRKRDDTPSMSRDSSWMDVSSQDNTPNKKRDINRFGLTHSAILLPGLMPSVGSQAGNNANTGDEVPVIPPPAKVAKIQPDYFTVDLPYYDKKTITRNVGAEATKGAYIVINLNSIYLIDTTSESSGDHIPNGRNTYAPLYQFYRVLKTHVKLKFVQKSTPVATQDMHVAGYALSDATSTLPEDYHRFVEGKATETDLVASTGYATILGQTATFEYTYTPQSWDNHVQDSTTNERWTALGSAPAEPHRLHAMAMPAGHAGNTVFDIYVWIKYTVQYREANFRTTKDVLA